MYATKEDMLKRYTQADLIQLTDRVEPYTNTIIDDVLNQALEDAAATIDTYVANRYDLPVNGIPKALTIQACAIAYYNLHQGRHPDEIRTAYEDAISFLDKIASGWILLDIGGTEPQSSAAIAEYDAPDQMFSRDKLKGV